MRAANASRHNPAGMQSARSDAESGGEQALVKVCGVHFLLRYGGAEGQFKAAARGGRKDSMPFEFDELGRRSP